MLTITYADAPLLLEDPGFEFQVWCERALSLRDLNLFSESMSPLAEGQQAARNSEIKVGLPVPNYSSRKPPRWKINTLWWPTGATRHAVGLFLVSNDNLAKIAKSIKGGSGSHANTTADLVLGDGENGSLTTPMYMLPPRRVTNVDGEESCSLICLVDERYYWQRRSSGELSIDNDSTWKDLFDQLQDALDVDLTYATVKPYYGRPDPVEFSRRHQSAALLLDAAAASVGTRVVRSLDGRVHLNSPQYATGTYKENLGGLKILGGGDSIDPSRGRYPAKVQVVFPRRVDCDAIAPVSPVHAVEVSAGDAGFSGKSTSYDAKFFHSTAISVVDGTDPSEPTNKGALEDLAKNIAANHYDWLEKQYDISFAGLVEWTPNGYDDWIWWHAGYQYRVESSQLQRRHGDGLADLPLQIRDQDYAVLTRVSSHPSDFGVSNQLQQFADYEFRPPTMITGRVKTKVTESQETIPLEDVSLIYGVDPRDTPRSTGQVVEALNTHAQAYNVGEQVQAWQRCHDGEFVTLQTGGEDAGVPSANIEKFIMLEDKEAGDVEGKARLLLDDPEFWNTVATATDRLMLEVQDEDDNSFNTDKVKVGEWVKQTTPEGYFRYDGDQANTLANDPADWFEFDPNASEIRLVDIEKSIVAYGPYVDCLGNGEEAVAADPNASPPVEGVPGEGGFRGKAYKFTDDYDGTGFPGYYVVSIESLVPILYVDIAETYADGTQAKAIGTPGDELPAAGSGEQHRLPKQKVYAGGTGIGDPAEVIGIENVTDLLEVYGEKHVGDRLGVTLVPKSDQYAFAFHLRPNLDKEHGVAVLLEDLKGCTNDIDVTYNESDGSWTSSGGSELLLGGKTPEPPNEDSVEPSLAVLLLVADPPSPKPDGWEMRYIVPDSSEYLPGGVREDEEKPVVKLYSYVQGNIEAGAVVFFSRYFDGLEDKYIVHSRGC